MSIRRATIIDVAERAQVSKVAVSVVLHGSSSTTRVAEATRQRILQAAQDLRYTPNRLARALMSRQMNIIGLYLGETYVDARSPFITEIVAGMQTGCNDHRKDLLIHGTYRGQSIDDIHAELVGGKIDGLVLFAVEGDPLAERLALSALPAVTIADVASHLPAVVVDDAGGSSALARYLAERGHRRVLYRKGPPRQSSTVRRFEAFVRTATECGMSVIPDGGPAPGTDGPLADWEMALLSAPDGARPTAVACHRDGSAYAAMAYCQSIGLRVPEDVAVAGFDGVVHEVRPAVRLTTIRAPWAEVARRAVDLLMLRLGGEEVPAETVLPVELQPGETA